MRLRVGDVILAVDGKLLTMASAQTLMAESRKGRGGMRAKMATVSVLRATSSEHACYLIEQSTQQSRTGGASAPGSSHSQEGSSHGPSPPTKSPAKSGGGKSSDGKGSSAKSGRADTLITDRCAQRRRSVRWGRDCIACQSRSILVFYPRPLPVGTAGRTGW
mgnify:CR=1 FL=1